MVIDINFRQFGCGRLTQPRPETSIEVLGSKQSMGKGNTIFLYFNLKKNTAHVHTRKQNDLNH